MLSILLQIISSQIVFHSDEYYVSFYDFEIPF